MEALVEELPRSGMEEQLTNVGSLSLCLCFSRNTPISEQDVNQ